jgi:tetratricopeptide (TPR) repeat protein
VVARGMSRFPEDSRLYSLYTQYILAEADTVLPRGLALFPQNGELLALHAQRLRAGGNLLAAVDAMRQAIAVDSTIPDAALMLAQAELELGRPDSALASMQRALKLGTDSARIAQFAFARGNALYRAAQTGRKATDYDIALRFLALSDSVRQTAQTRLLVGMAALGVAQAAFTEAVEDPDEARRCTMVLNATNLLPLARTALEGGRDVANEAVEQGLGYVAQLEPYSATAIKAFCPEGTPVPAVGAAAVTVPAVVAPAPGVPATPPDTTNSKPAPAR